VEASKKILVRLAPESMLPTFIFEHTSHLILEIKLLDLPVFDVPLFEIISSYPESILSYQNSYQSFIVSIFCGWKFIFQVFHYFIHFFVG